MYKSLEFPAFRLEKKNLLHSEDILTTVSGSSTPTL